MGLFFCEKSLVFFDNLSMEVAFSTYKWSILEDIFRGRMFS